MRRRTARIPVHQCYAYRFLTAILFGAIALNCVLPARLPAAGEDLSTDTIEPTPFKIFKPEKPGNGEDGADEDADETAAGQTRPQVKSPAPPPGDELRLSAPYPEKEADAGQMEIRKDKARTEDESKLRERDRIAVERLRERIEILEGGKGEPAPRQTRPLPRQPVPPAGDELILPIPYREAEADAGQEDQEERPGSADEDEPGPDSRERPDQLVDESVRGPASQSVLEDRAGEAAEDVSVDEELLSAIEDVKDVVAVDEADDLLYEALGNVQDGDYRIAVPKLEQVIKLKPELGAAWESLGWCYYRLGAVQKTSELWRRLRILDPDRPLAYNLLAKLATAENNLPQAIEYYRRSLEIDPDQYDVRYALARTLRWEGSLDVSIEMLRKVLESDPNRTDVMLDLARALTDNWDYREALPLWTRLREYVPDNREFIEGEALCRLHTGDVELARELSGRLLEEYPGNAPALLISANLAQRSENPEQALPYLRQMMEQESDPVEQEGIRVRLLRLLVSLHDDEPGRFGLGEAIELARERIDYDRKSVDARLMLAELLLMSGRYEESEMIFAFVLARINPHNLRARKGMFEVQMAMRDYKKAYDQLVGIAEFNPHDPYLYYYISRWKATKGDYHGANAALDKLERAGQKGAVPVFLFHGLTTSDYFMDALSVDLFREQVQALKAAGFRFLKSSDIPAFFQRRNYYGSGILLDERKMNIPPERVVVINFDDARRDSMRYGTEVAQEEGVVFSMHIPTGYVNMRHPFICNWGQLEMYAEKGVWDFGSHFKDAAILAPIEADGRLGHALANRIWRADLGRMENMSEYTQRLDLESSESRRQLEQHLGGNVNFVSYPFGDIGQEINTNVRNPVRTILNHVRPHYDLGFIQSPFGFAVNGDDPMLYQRHEMDRFASGEALVEHIFLNHPVYLARRQRAELAALQGKQYLATRIVDDLELAGYPERLIEKLRREIYDDLAGKIGEPDEMEDASAVFGLPVGKPYIGVEAEVFSDNQERSRDLLVGYAGTEIMRRLSIEGLLGYGSLEQEVLPEDDTQTRRKIDIDEEEVGLRAALRLYASNYLRAELVERSFTSSSNEYKKLKYAVEGQFRPVLACDLLLRYEDDAGPSALAVEQEIDSESFWANAAYRLTDYWDMTAALVNFDFSDDNKRDHYSLGTSWLLNERSGFRAGVGYSYASSDKDTQAYWSPYELRRYYIEAGFQGSYLRNYYNIRLRLGTGRESVRPEDEAGYEDLKLRAAALNFDPGPPPEEDWETIIGVSASTRIPIRNKWSLDGEISYSKLPNYDSLTINGGVRYDF